MTQRIALSLLLLNGLTACSGAGAALPNANQGTIATAHSTVTSAARMATGRANSTSTYSYTAPWGGFGGAGAIYVLHQGACGDISATVANGFSWPLLLNNLKPGTTVTMTGVPSYADAWSQANNCPTGGIVVSSIVTGSSPSPSPSPSPSAMPSNAHGIDIHAGGAATGSWLADTDFTSGAVSATSAAIDTSHAVNPAPQSLYQTHRYGASFSYVISNLAKLASYTVRLHFAETYWNDVGKRVFGVSINGSQVLANFDIFQAAHGQNIAIVKQYNATTDANGQISIDFAATTNNAMVSGLEVITGQTSGAGPSPTPTAVATTPANGSSQYPIYSSLFTAPNNPFHMTFNALRALPNQVNQPSNATSMSNNLWNQGTGSQAVSAIPIYQGTASYASYVVSCTTYSQSGCGAQGASVHLPSRWRTQNGSDHHVTIVDLVGGREDDMWGGVPPHICDVNNSDQLDCSWGGDYKFSTKGLQSTRNDGSGVAGGFAEGLFEITAGDLLNGAPIQHALGINTACLDNDYSQGSGGSVYPSDRGDSGGTCKSFGLPGGAPPYGAMWHVKNSVDVNGLGYGPYCTKIVQAMQTYGMYTMDTGNGQLEVEVENPIAYNAQPYSSNPFYTKIWPSMVASGDGTGSNDNFWFRGCLNRLNASDMEIYYVPNLGF